MRESRRRALTERSDSKMAAQFAGSRSLDERRRRRLATESEEAAPEPIAAPLIPRRTSAPKALGQQRGPSHFPLRKVISSRLWKHAGLAFLGLGLSAGILAGGVAAQTEPARLGPGVAWFFDLSTARLVRWYVSSALFLASELALLVWWLRSQSLQDFNGRYRGWACCAVLGFLAAFAVQTDAFRAWSTTLDWLWPVDLRNKQALSWLVPVFLFALPAWRFLHREMRDCRTSRTLLWFAAVFGGAFAAILLGGRLPVGAWAERVIQCSLAMLCAQCLCFSFLFQARHAIYVTVEPPADRPAWFLALWRRYWTAAKESRARKSGRTSSDSAVSTARARRGKPPRRAGRSADAPPKQPDSPPIEAAEKTAAMSRPHLRGEQRPMRRSA
jgi:hypothetical protein